MALGERSRKLRCALSIGWLGWVSCDVARDVRVLLQEADSLLGDSVGAAARLLVYVLCKHARSFQKGKVLL